jgi:patatin-related protein
VREKELRIALVCFGGVSLAVYMHGVTKEVLKLVRASSALHALSDSERPGARFADRFDMADPEHDSEAAYFEVLRDIGRTVGLRVVVDIVAGASAGGINGALLARALSHDLPMGVLRDLWLERADVTELLDPEARAGAYSKWFLKPVVWSMGAFRTLTTAADREARLKLSLFVRSRWFKPPLSGERMTEFVYDAMSAQEPPRGTSLLPSGHKLDLFITLTDHYGYRRPVEIHQPPLIHEREHRHILHFHYERRATGEVTSDFDLDGVPGLAFAARATSSFPGAFPSAQIGEVDRLLVERGAHWPRRAAFLAHNFADYARFNVDPASAYFVDGSVLNNRPFRQAIEAIRGRPAYRQVDRRLVYIDPDPRAPDSAMRRREPGFFQMLKSALSDLPSTQPVVDELNWLAEYNARMDRLREIVRDARPRITRRVAAFAGRALDGAFDAERVRSWRVRSALAAMNESGFAYEGYIRLRLTSVRAMLAELVATHRGAIIRSPLGEGISAVIDAWAANTGRDFGDIEANRSWWSFLNQFDLDFFRRRLHFMIEGQNRLYQRLDQPAFAGTDPDAVDRLKQHFYEELDRLNAAAEMVLADEGSHDLVEHLFQAAPLERGSEALAPFAHKFVERHGAEFETLVARMAKLVDLEAHRLGVDKLMTELDAGWSAEARREVLVDYLGFPFWDVLTFPLMTWRETGEFNRILVDRLSPEDAHSLAPYSGARSLRGARLGHFAGFLSRAYRENDYLLGRLHALDRLVDVVCNSAGLDPAANRRQITAWKAKGFALILDAEEAHLADSKELIAGLRGVVEKLRQA